MLCVQVHVYMLHVWVYVCECVGVPVCLLCMRVCVGT